MASISYNYLLDHAQEAIVAILSNDSTVTNSTTGTTNIFDGIPTALLRGTGFPTIIVHTPTISEERYTQTRFKIMVTFDIEVIDKKEGNVRVLSDAVRNALSSNQSSLRGNRLTHYRVADSFLSHTFLADEQSTPVWSNTLQVEFRWCGT